MMAITAPTAAPADTPTVAGSARGLRKMPCMMTPATAKLAPTKIASTIRGRRTCQNTLWATASAVSRLGPSPMMPNKSDKEIRKAPVASDSRVVTLSNATRNTATAGRLVRRAMVMRRC